MPKETGKRGVICVSCLFFLNEKNNLINPNSRVCCRGVLILLKQFLSKLHFEIEQRMFENEVRLGGGVMAA